MRFLFLAFFALTICGLAKAEMLPSSAIGNDPQKEQLCASRAKVQPVPFEIDPGYVKRERAMYPDATFIADDNVAQQLIVCILRPGTGRFEPDISMPEGNIWRLPKPQQFQPSVNSQAGIAKAAKACLAVASTKITRSSLDHSVSTGVQEVQKRSPMYPLGKTIGGAKIERYDVAVTGKSFYKSGGPDLDTVNFTCLFSPMLVLKGFAAM